MDTKTAKNIKKTNTEHQRELRAAIRLLSKEVNIEDPEQPFEETGVNEEFYKAILYFINSSKEENKDIAIKFYTLAYKLANDLETFAERANAEEA